MAFLDVIERGTFFRLTRIVAFLWLLLLTASTVLSLVLFIASTGRSPGHVAPDSALPPSKTSIAAEPAGGESLNQSSNASPLLSLRIPLAVQSYLNNRQEIDRLWQLKWKCRDGSRACDGLLGWRQRHLQISYRSLERKWNLDEFRGKGSWR